MKKYWVIGLAVIGLFIAFTTFRGGISKKPFNVPFLGAMPDEMDLAGGPERKTRGFQKRNSRFDFYVSRHFVASGASDEKRLH